ncbi:MAG: VWA domain-containing protein [Mesonia hippocampi]|uniref:VWA domain-containing protein n=1 Tax=Mesonia hippocampi TaxID=1628250 RepID=UPI003F9AEBDD
MFVLEEKIYFWFLLSLPLVILVYLLLVLWRKKTQKKFASAELLKKLSPNKSSFKAFLKLVWLCLALGFLTIALVNPKMGERMETMKREGVDVVFAMDVSKSMLAEDIAPNRLEKSKQLVNQIINQLVSDRVGIVAYAGSAFPQLPITTDYSSARLFLQSLNTDMLSSQGTAIYEAIQLAETYYNDDSQTNRVLILISDGEDHEGDIEAYAEDAAKKGIKIVTIGVGTKKGGPIPIKERGVTRTYKKDRSGETVITRLDENTLKKIAQETNGIYLDGTNTKQVTEELKKFLATIEKSESETKKYADYKDQFQWFLAIGIFFLLLEVLTLDRKTAWITKLNLFNEKKEDEA